MWRKENGKIKIIVILISFIALSAMVGAGYIGIKIWWAKNQPRQSLGGMKISSEVLNWSYGNTPELYGQIIALDDMISMLETELKRLKALGQKYPAQLNVIAQERQQLSNRKANLVAVLTKAGQAIEAIYVLYTIDARKGREKIGSKETYELSKQLTSTLRSSSRLVFRIKSQNPETWIDKLKKIF